MGTNRPSQFSVSGERLTRKLLDTKLDKIDEVRGYFYSVMTNVGLLN